MDSKSFTATLESILDNAKTAILATVDSEGKPHTRWMTPAILRDRPGAIYAVTSPDFAKISQLESNPNAQWMFQTKMIDKIATVNGRINVIDNSAMKSEVIEGIGRRLTVFWRVNTDATKLVVLETVMEEGVYFEPMNAKKETITFE